MKNFKKSFILLIFVCSLFLCQQNAYAGTASIVADKAIDCTAKGAYYVTKYTLKATCFIVKKSAKGVFLISKGIFNGTKDAFFSPKPKPISKPENISQPVNVNQNNVYSLPSIPNPK